MNIPEDTLYEREPYGLSDGARKLLKIIILSLAEAHGIMSEFGMTETEVIDAIEQLRRKDRLKICQDEQGFFFQLTPVGATEAWLAKITSDDGRRI